MTTDSNNRLDREVATNMLVGSLRSTAALVGAARTFDVTPADLGQLLDLIAEKAESVAALSGFD